MKKSDPKQGIKQDQLWCECECNCEIGAHERCHSPKCHMLKWKDVKSKPLVRR
jgi:hypothetical protein